MAALVRRFAAGAGLTALALVLLLAAGTGEARLALFGGLLALALLGWAVAFLRCVARQVAGFTDELCRTLDGMLDRSARPAPAAPAEPLSAPAVVTAGQAPEEPYDLPTEVIGLKDWIGESRWNHDPVGLLAELPERELSLYGVTKWLQLSPAALG